MSTQITDRHTRAALDNAQAQAFHTLQAMRSLVTKTARDLTEGKATIEELAAVLKAESVARDTFHSLVGN